MEPIRPNARPFLLIGLVWFAIALGLGASGRLQLLRPPAPQLVLAGLTALLIASGVLSGTFRSWLGSLRLRRIVALHLTRFVGAYFLVLYGRGELPYLFAVPGGWGDIAIASGALLLVLLVPALEQHSGWLLLWNLLGLADILFVAATAARLAFADPASMSALQRLPLSLLPTFLVPLIIASHLLIFWRVLRSPK
jgi:hypothetical protein